MKYSVLPRDSAGAVATMQGDFFVIVAKIELNSTKFWRHPNESGKRYPQVGYRIGVIGHSPSRWGLVIRKSFFPR